MQGHSRNRAKLHIGITLGIMALIFLHSAMPADLSSSESKYFEIVLAMLLKTEPQKVTFAVRKSAHFLEYAVLGASLVFTVSDLMKEKTRRMAVFAWMIGAFYGITDEVHQFFVSGRSCEIRDAVIDGGGVAFGVLLVYFMFIKKQISSVSDS